jgi:carboxymethylenebutenolidase
MGEKITFPSNGSTCDGYLALPAEPNGRAIIVIQEWWGLVGHITEVADRFAEHGYVALAPDLYHGAQTKEPDEAMRLMMGLAMDTAAKDIAGAASYLATRSEVSAHGIGAVGFCLGGSLALWSATLSPLVTATVGYYPGIPWTKMSPEWSNYTNKAAIIHCSEHDGTSSAPGIQSALVAIREAGGSAEAFDYAGSEHAFFNSDRPEVYDAAHAELSWERTLAFFASHLKQELS